MDGWKQWEGKRVFIRLKQGREYSGLILYVEDSDPHINFITLRDKFGKIVTFVHSEIKLIQEEANTDGNI